MRGGLTAAQRPQSRQKPPAQASPRRRSAQRTKGINRTTRPGASRPGSEQRTGARQYLPSHWGHRAARGRLQDISRTNHQRSRPQVDGQVVSLFTRYRGDPSPVAADDGEERQPFRRGGQGVGRRRRASRRSPRAGGTTASSTMSGAGQEGHQASPTNLSCRLAPALVTSATSCPFNRCSLVPSRARHGLDVHQARRAALPASPTVVGGRRPDAVRHLCGLAADRGQGLRHLLLAVRDAPAHPTPRWM